MNQQNFWVIRYSGNPGNGERLNIGVLGVDRDAQELGLIFANAETRVEEVFGRDSARTVSQVELLFRSALDMSAGTIVRRTSKVALFDPFLLVPDKGLGVTFSPEVAGSYASLSEGLEDLATAYLNSSFSRNKQRRAPKISKVALVGSYAPMQNGIATYTTDLHNALAVAYPKTAFDVIAVTDQKGSYSYPGEVVFEIDQHDEASYRSAARFLNENGYEAICIQHEYGIFGGEAGDYILELMDGIRMPAHVNLHTILSKPSKPQRRVLEELGRRAASVLVNSRTAEDLLRSMYYIPDSTIQHIPLGVPGPAPAIPGLAAKLSIAEESKVLLTFGLLSPDKGIETAIRAMPKIIERVPEAIYLIVGATHPTILARQGEIYRESLESLVHELGVEEHVLFVNRSIELSELTEFLNFTDIYVTPYLKAEQTTSGPLAYAVGSGRAMISTPYWYAKELLADGRGILVPFRSHEAIADAAISLLTNPEALRQMEERSQRFGNGMLWSEISRKYMDVIEAAASVYIQSKGQFEIIHGHRIAK